MFHDTSQSLNKLYEENLKYIYIIYIKLRKKELKNIKIKRNHNYQIILHKTYTGKDPGRNSVKTSIGPDLKQQRHE